MENDYSLIVSAIIESLNKLKEDFISSVTLREINCSQVKEERKELLEIVSLNYENSDFDSILLMKPRFTPAIQLLPHDKRIHTINLFEKIKFHFEEYPFYQIPEHIFKLFHTNEQDSGYKYSLLCLVENQVHKTDEIYGDYLGIVKKRDSELSVTIHSTRRRELREVVCSYKIFLNMQDVANFLNDYTAKRINEVISDRFSYLLSILIRGKANFKLLSQKYPKIPNSRDTHQILIMGRKRLIVNQFDGLFYLGYAMEHWVKNSIISKYNNDVSSQKLYNLIEFLKADNWFKIKTIDILHKIRIEYNNLRHEPEYPINSNLVWELYEKFQKIIEDSKYNQHNSN